MPLFVALLSVVVLGERIGRTRRLGLALILAGIAALVSGGATLGEGRTWIGHTLFLAAAFLWACFTIVMSGACPGPSPFSARRAERPSPLSYR
jgi:drug/metabolite transporter (DMT)-like permease